MKTDCNVARDLMPLCIDEAASEESKAYLNDHLAQCETCKALFEDMKTAIHLFALGQPIPLNLLSDAVSPTLGRMLCGGLWAGAGSLLALLSDTTSAATVGQLCLCYGLMMVGTRFFPQVDALNPLLWMNQASPFLWLGLLALGVVLGFVNLRQVKASV